ncbi:nuclease-related domain-containing protein [Virgibacillus sp. DJP39]|uniref:nuclease-related domain-containing protein n=1 Tax=Virgibacillus sp. DJP39 TaxID=3409790 RepID=UPI003BB58A8C
MAPQIHFHVHCLNYKLPVDIVNIKQNNGEEDLMFLDLFKKNKNKQTNGKKGKVHATRKDQQHVANRKGEIGEYKINIQLDQMPKEYKYLSDVMVENKKSSTGYSQIDHIVITPYGIFVIETKNYQGTIYGGENRKQWSVNGKFQMLNPFIQNYGHIEALKTLLHKKFQNSFVSMVSFTKRCTFKIDVELRKINSSKLIVYDVELTEFINRKISILKLIHNEPLFLENDISNVHRVIHDANIINPELRKQHNNGIQKKKEQPGKKLLHRCVHCNKPVSDKVASYCQSNKRFEGKIYCYEHQSLGVTKM